MVGEDPNPSFFPTCFHFLFSWNYKYEMHNDRNHLKIGFCPLLYQKKSSQNKSHF